MKRPNPAEFVELQSIATQTAPLRLTAIERFERFKLEPMTELVLRVAGILAIAASILVMILQPFTTSAGQVVLSNAMLAAMCAATGLLLYAYGTRGFRREFRLDTAAKTLTLTKVNIRGRSRMGRIIDIDDIESIFARRPGKSGEMAVLQIRLADHPAPIAVISGQFEDLRALHVEMCAMINASRPDADETQGSKPGEPKAAKPRLFASARA